MGERFLPIKHKSLQSVSQEIDAQIAFDQAFREDQKRFQEKFEEIEELLAEPTIVFEKSPDKKGTGKVFKQESIYTFFAGSSDEDGGAPSSQKKKEANRWKQSQRKTRKNL
jgi:hypothetical protein